MKNVLKDMRNNRKHSLPTNLLAMSADELEALAKKCVSLAKDLRKKEPTYALALAGGVYDISYQTVSNGSVDSYSGIAIITMSDGRKWRAVGRGPQGDAYTITRQGYIEFIPM